MNPDKSEIKKLVVQYIFEVYITEAPKLRAVLWGAVVLLGMYTMMFALDTKLSIESKITVISLYSCLICVFFIPRVFTWPPYFDISNFWIIEYNKKIVAFGELKKGSKVFTIRKLFVTSAWRRRGLGSALVKHFMEETNQPLHVVSCPKLAKFYTQLGFVPSQSSNGTIKLVYEDKWIDAEPG
jgi:GNAT superfamily N-acetyltransferase